MMRAATKARLTESSIMTVPTALTTGDIPILIMP
jgi:hypothetical protein